MYLERNEAMEEIKHSIKMSDYLEKSKGTNMYCCPFCGSGHGKNHTGALKIYPETHSWYCHKCGAHGDVFDLYQFRTGVSFNQALKELASQLNISLLPYKK